jgi:hypothetical protein
MLSRSGGVSNAKVQEMKSHRESRNTVWRWLLIACALTVPARAVAGSTQTLPPENETAKSSFSTTVQSGCSMFDLPLSSEEASGSNASSHLRIGFVPSRRADLEQTIAGYERSKTPFVAFDGKQFVPAGFADDPGLYYFVPAMCRILHTNLDESIFIFYLSILGIAFAIGAVGFTLILSGWPSRIIGIGWLLIVAVLVYKIGDLYLVEFALPAILVPWGLWWVCGRPNKFRVGFGLFLFFSGFLVAIAQLLRLSAGPPAIAFMLILLILCLRASRKWKLVGLSLLVAGFLLPRVYFDHLASQRDQFLANRPSEFQFGSSRHAFWHFAYMGLGFLHNAYVQGSCDDFNKEKVRSISPDAAYLSVDYDRILKQETLAVVRHHPMFAMFTLAAKLGIVLTSILVFANIGLLFIKRLPTSLQIALWTPLLVSTIPLLIIVPLKLYFVGVIAYSTMLGIVAALRLMTRVGSPPPEANHYLAGT